jgi:hypothetical protein
VKYTTKAQDAAFIRSMFANQATAWKVGDECLSYDLGSKTTITAITGTIVTCANGDEMHISKVNRIDTDLSWMRRRR